MVVDHGVNLRQAEVRDAPAVADLHIRAWQWAYKGQMPDDFLVGLAASLESRTAWWQGVLGAAESEGRTWLAQMSGQVVGFASTGPGSDSDPARGTAFLYAIYLDQSMVGRGIGRVLLAHALSDLAERGYEVARLWVLVTNERARRFYEAAGWELDGETRIEQQPGFDLVEVRYRIALSSAG
jgi:ribosomal protein S18 acetylase RimI-like enzyme